MGDSSGLRSSHVYIPSTDLLKGENVLVLGLTILSPNARSAPNPLGSIG